MAFDRRGNFRRSRWIDGRVVTQFIPAGPAAEQAARLDAVDRECRALRRAVEQNERQQAAARDAPLEELNELVDQLVRAALMVGR